MDDDFRMRATNGHDIYPSSKVDVKRTASAGARLEAYLHRQSPMKENTIADVNVGLCRNVSSESDIPNRLRKVGSIHSSIKSLAISNSSGVYVGCVINTTSRDRLRLERHYVSSSEFDDSDTDTENSHQGAPRYGTKRKDLSSTKGCFQDPYLQNVIDNTNLVLKNCKMQLFERTPAYELAFQTLSRYGAIFVTGNLGDGKTMTSRKLMLDMKKKNSILIEINARNHANFEALVNSERDTVIFIDDFLGKEYMDGRLLTMWTERFPLMEDMIRAGKVQFILATRKDILEEAKCSLNIFEFFRKERIVDMTTCDLSGVKERILMRHVDTSPIFVTEDDTSRYFSEQLRKRTIITSEEIKEISKIETPIGYPLCCYLYTREKTWADEGKIFFQNPVLYIKSQIERIESEDIRKYCVLAVVLLCCGKVSHYDISRNSHSKLFRLAVSKVSETCEIQLQTATVARVSRILASSGTFLRSTDDGGFIFSHDAVEKAMALAYCRKGLKDIIEMCPFGFILEMVVTNSHDSPGIIYSYERLETSSKIELSVLDFDMLANRVVHEILCGNVSEVSHHNAFLDSTFLDRFFAIFWECAKNNEVMNAKHSVDFLLYAADNEVPRSELLERLLKFHSENQPRKRNHARSKLNYLLVPRGHTDYLDNVMSRALDTACRLGRKEICDVLLRSDARKTPSLLSTAIQGQNVEIVQSLLQKYKWSKEQKKHALLEACKHGNIELYDLMLKYVKAKWGACIFSKCLLESAKSGNVDLCENILDKGCDVNYKGYIKRCALHEACIGAHESLVIRLLKVPNINIHATDKKGYSALHYAAEYNLLSIVKLLINAEANIEVSVGNDVQTVATRLRRRKKPLLNPKEQEMLPYELARLRGHIEVCMLLEDAAFSGIPGSDHVLAMMY